MILERFPDIQKLTKEERVLLFCELQDVVVGENELINADPEIVAELDRRIEEYRQDPSGANAWAEVRSRLRSSLSSGASE